MIIRQKNSTLIFYYTVFPFSFAGVYLYFGEFLTLKIEYLYMNNTYFDIHAMISLSLYIYMIGTQSME